MSVTFSDVYEKLCERYPDPGERGRQFERLIADVLRTDRTFEQRFSQVWLWRDWPGRTSGDIGVDIVAERADGGYAAIQCKCYDPEHTIAKGELDSFLANTQQNYVERIVFTTTPKWSNNAVHMLEWQQPPVQRYDCFGLVDGSTVDWSPFIADEDAPLRATQRKELRPHQVVAHDAVVEGLQSHDRGKLIMACGTGKTLTSLRIAETIAGANGRVLVCAPSISLLAQVLREWTAEAKHPGQAFVVCSDVQVGKRTATKADADAAAAYDLIIPPTTSAERLAAAAAAPAVGQTVVFSTYQSLPVIQKAQELGLPEFDFAICDEAHRTTGVTRAGEDPSHFVLIHNATSIRARKRLYMTATPRIYLAGSKSRAQKAGADYYSMDDEANYGPELHRLTFHEAVEQDLLADYKVLVLAVNQAKVARRFEVMLDDPDVKLDDAAKIVGCLNGLAKTPGPESDGSFGPDDEPMRRAVAFANTIKASKAVTQLIEQAQQDDTVGLADRLRVEASHVDGTDGVLTRSERLNWLGGETPGQCRVLSNARCLTEGIDVPALDAVLFLQPRKSQIDVVQAVGRIMRKVEGKRFGYVILPIVIPPDQEPETALARNAAYIHVWEVLQALRSHDERFDAHVNQIDLKKKRDDVIKVIGVGFEGGDQDEEGDQTIGVTDLDTPYVQPTLDFEPWADAIYARIVENVGDRRYWDRWARSVTRIAATHEDRIQALIDSPSAGVRAEFRVFANALRENLNDSISDARAVSMLSQHMITRPVFEALFGGRSFTQHNPVSQVMQRMVDTLEGRGLEAETEQLQEFYASVRRRIEGIDTTAGRQQVIRDLYENFFQLAFPKDARALGVVYTPVEIVDFIIRSVEDLLRREFNASLSDVGVHVIDPFTGTGTFITRLLETGFIQSHDLARKFTEELHANEFLLLAYYIAAVNIETTYEALVSSPSPSSQSIPDQVPDLDDMRDGIDYQPFEGIVLTDTFQLSEDNNLLALDVFPRNSHRAERQLKLHDIRVIIGNPPWSVGQGSQNDYNPRRSYPTLDSAIETTYASASDAGLKRNLYDSYSRAIRWASNRILPSEGGGIIGFVTNGGFIDSKSFDGFRKTIVSDFHEIYCYNLRGGSRSHTKGEGGNVFGARVSPAILILVKRPEPVTRQSRVNYHTMEDDLSTEQKLATLDSIRLNDIKWDTITPDQHGDWINQRNPQFLRLRSLAHIGSDSHDVAPFFEAFSYGLVSNRDAWVFNSSATLLRDRLQHTVREFNAQCEAFVGQAFLGTAKDRLKAAQDFISRDTTRFSWDSATERRLASGRPITIRDDGYRVASYRPFFRQHVYMDRAINARVGSLPQIFPGHDYDNVGIFVTSRSIGGLPGVLATDAIPALHFAGTDGRLFPRFSYHARPEAHQQGEFFGGAETGKLKRIDNIKPDTLRDFRARYGIDVTSDQVFAYIYALLHLPEYHRRYSIDLAKLMPRIPVVSDVESFHKFAESGQRLLDLHLNYETATEFPLGEERSLGYGQMGQEVYRVEKMRFSGVRGSTDRSTLIYNDHITLRGIPDETHDYVIGPRSALAWVIDRYQVRTDDPSGIVNDPNEWATEHGNPRYILDLVKRIVTVSLETVRIVRNLPPLDEAP